MTQNEAKKILATITSLYPHFAKGRSIGLTTQMWQYALQDCSLEQGMAALMEYFATDTSGYPPVPGNLRAIISRKSQGETLSDLEAWHLVRKAISRSAYYSGEEFRKLPPLLQQLVGSPSSLREWANMEEQLVQTSVASMFMRAYRNRVEQEARSVPFLGAPELPALMEE